MIFKLPSIVSIWAKDGQIGETHIQVDALDSIAERGDQDHIDEPLGAAHSAKVDGQERCAILHKSVP